MIEQRNKEMATLQIRSDTLIAQRDAEVRRSLGSLEAAVDAFRKFEAHEHETHSRLLDHMDASAELQQSLLIEMRSMHQSISTHFVAEAASKVAAEVAKKKVDEKRPELRKLASESYLKA
jgi:ribosomal protein L9